MNLVVFFLTLLVFSSGHGQNWYNESGEPIQLLDSLSQIPKGSIIILGESHNHMPHQKQHIEVMQALRGLGHTISVGFEFFDYNQQRFVDLYHQKQLSEADFLNEIGWKNGDFKYYRDRATFPIYEEGGDLLALNLPRWVSSQIARKGIDLIDENAKALLPPNFEIGNENYFDRFKEIMGGHGTVESLKNMFTAQCSWDDTMAWVATDYAINHPEKTLVLIAGDFHVQYGGGLPDRLKVRLSLNPAGKHRYIYPISFIKQQDLGPDGPSLEESIKPHPKYGPRGYVIGVD